jgi:hypothetical protein
VRARLGGLLVGALLGTGSAVAQDWSPFRDPGSEPPRRERPAARETAPPVPPADARPPLSPMEGISRWFSGKQDSPRPDPTATGEPANRPDAPPPGRDAVGFGQLPAPLDSRGRSVEVGDLGPAPAPDKSGLPYEMWEGLDLAKLEQLMAEIEMPPRSPALAGLWRRFLTADVATPAGARDTEFQAVRLEALYRSGLVAGMEALLDRQPTRQPVLALMRLRLDLARGRRTEACASQREATAVKADLPRPLRLEALLAGGWCAAVAGNGPAAGLAADLAREEGAEQGFALQALDALALGRKPAGPLPKRLGPLDYRLWELGGGDLAQAIDHANPALLVALAEDQNTPPRERIAAAEAAAKLGALDGDRLAEVWRRTSAGRPDESPNAVAADVVVRRAALFRAAEAERTPQRKARQIRALLDDARRVGLYVPAARALERATAELQVTPEIGWFAETAIEVMLLGGRTDDVRRLAGLSQLDRTNEPLAHWLALADIADPALTGRRGESLASVEQLALRGRFGNDLLHRLATVLDALDYNVPIPLWEAASRTPQPTGGHLPGTGVLSELAEAAKRKQFGRTVMLAMQTIGPDGADKANILALGDAIRALKRAGFEADARRLGLEALFATWPRSTSN